MSALQKDTAQQTAELMEKLHHFEAEREVAQEELRQLSGTLKASKIENENLKDEIDSLRTENEVLKARTSGL